MNEKDVWKQINALREAASYIKPKGDQEAILVLATQVERLEAQRKQLREALLCSVAAFDGDEIIEILADYGEATAQRVEIARAALKETE